MSDEEWVIDSRLHHAPEDTASAYAPNIPAELLGDPGPHFFEWVVDRCLEWYDNSWKEAAARLFFVLMDKHPVGRRLVADRDLSIVPQSYSQGRQQFEAALRTFAPPQ